MTTRRTRILREVLFVYLVTIGMIKLFYELRFLSVVQNYLWTAAMLLQVYVPAWMYHRHQLPLSVSGLHFRRWREGLKLWLLVSLIFFVPSVIGNHLWQLHYQRELSLQGSPHLRFDASVKGIPPPAKQTQDIQLYTTSGYPNLVIRWQDSVQGFLQSDGQMRVISGGQWIQGDSIGNQLRFSGGRNGTPLRIHTEGRWVSFQFKRRGQDVALKYLKKGPQEVPLKERQLSRGWFWLLHLILVQLLMVALPEELFYRGYMQTRLDAIFPPRPLFFGLPFSYGNLLTSVLFALTHFLIGYQFYRFGVFFPSLLFGMLRHKTGSLLACILFHATANILMKILELGYV